MQEQFVMTILSLILSKGWTICKRWAVLYIHTEWSM